MIAGTVVNAVTGSGIAGATVVLEPEVGGAFPGPAAGRAFATRGRTVVSDSTGAYRFEGVSSGVYRVYVSRYSYRPYSVTVELRPDARSSISIGLVEAPIALQPVDVRAAPRNPFRALGPAGLTVENRLLALEMRRRQFLTTDVRELTDADVSEAVTLGEPDIFRALQRLPGVAAPSDYSAVLWTRGAPWSHTRVYFDGVPLFNPLHAMGVLSGVGSGGVGAVWFYPGARSAGIGEGAAGVVDLQSRRAEGSGEFNLNADLSLLSAGLAADQRLLDGRLGWTITARRTYLDWLSSLAERATGTESDFPYGFKELTGRIDVRVGNSTVVELSSLYEADYLVRAEASGTPALRNDWGNNLARAALIHRLKGLNARHGLGVSRHHGTTGNGVSRNSSGDSWKESLSEVVYVGLSGLLWPDPVSIAGPAWTAGYGLEYHVANYDGPLPLAVPNLPVPPDTAQLGSTLRTSWLEATRVAVLWGERMWEPLERVSLRAGARLEMGGGIAGSGPLRIAPRFGGRLAVTPEVSLSTGYSRIFQYTQALAPAGVHLASLVSGDVWMVAGADVPALRSDIITFGIEGLLESGFIGSANLFGRGTSGVALTDPRPGPVFGRPPLYTGEMTAYGAELSMRRIIGPVTGSVAYTHSRARTAAAGLEFPSSADRTHVVDATTMVRALPSLRLGAAVTGATGSPYTAMLSDSVSCAGEPGCDTRHLPWAAAPNAQRSPAFASLDLLADWSTAVGGLELGIYAQLRNALGRKNATIYVGGRPGCLPDQCDSDGLYNAYERGLPRLLVLGARARR